MTSSSQPKKILFDAGPMVNGVKTGVGYYTYQLIDSLAQNHPDWEFVGHYFDFLGRKDVRALPKQPNIRYRTSKLVPGKVLAICRRLHFQFPYELLIKERGDVVIFPNFVSLPTLFPIRKVVTVHDLCYVRFPEYVQIANRRFLQRFVPPTVAGADLVLSVSDFTKQEIVDYYHADPAKILTTPIPPAAPTITPDKGSLTIPDKYILFVGMLEPRKNYAALVEGYRLLPEALKQQYGLVLAGGFGWHGKDTQDRIRSYIAAGESITMTGYISDAEKAYLYQNASLFAHASHYEGFGMPILEALQQNLPLAIADIPVFHEVAENAAEYFDKDNPQSIADALARVLQNPERARELQATAPTQAHKYHWDEITKQIGERIAAL